MFIKRSRLGILCLAPNKGEGEGVSTPEPPKTLAEATARIATMAGELASANQRADSAEAERDQLQGQFDTATQAAADANAAKATAEANLATANTTIQTITGERDKARTDLATANTNIGRLEKLCGVKGINGQAAVPSETSEHSASDDAVYTQWKSLSGAAKTKFYRENRAALDRYESVNS